MSLCVTASLCKPTLQHLDSWISFVEECDDLQLSGFWDYPHRPASWEQYILDEEKRRLPEQVLPVVPNSTYWLVDDGEVVAAVNIRHVLTDHLKMVGGNIGYAVRPSRWNQGYGTLILELALPKASALGINPVMITCADDNVASARIIEKNGGVLDDTYEYQGRVTRRYFVDQRETEMM